MQINFFEYNPPKTKYAHKIEGENILFAEMYNVTMARTVTIELEETYSQSGKAYKHFAIKENGEIKTRANHWDKAMSKAIHVFWQQ